MGVDFGTLVNRGGARSSACSIIELPMLLLSTICSSLGGSVVPGATDVLVLPSIASINEYVFLCCFLEIHVRL